ncbi:hypothetical protein DI005_31915 [Prauserella sp. PE36]|nr:hypothetical protein DI005_31915 [Prauserella sp. PE36]
MGRRSGGQEAVVERLRGGSPGRGRPGAERCRLRGVLRAGAGNRCLARRRGRGRARCERGLVSLAVVDASVLVAFYAADDVRRPETAAHLSSGNALFAPAHLDAEVISALRGMARGNAVLSSAVPGALRHLAHFPVRRMPIAPLLERMWELRDNVTAYDAAYVALAERLDGTLITCDAKLAAASGARCVFDLIT